MFKQSVSTLPENTRSLSQNLNDPLPKRRSHVPQTRYQFYVDPLSLERAHQNLRTGTRASASRLLLGLGEKTSYHLLVNLAQKPVVSENEASLLVTFREARFAAETGDLQPLSVFCHRLAQQYQLPPFLVPELSKASIQEVQPPQKRSNDEPQDVDCFSGGYEEPVSASFLENLPDWAKLPYEQAKQRLVSFGVGSDQERLESALWLLDTLKCPKRFSSMEDYLSYRIDASFPLWAQANSAEATVLSLLAEVPQDPPLPSSPEPSLNQDSNQVEPLVVAMGRSLEPSGQLAHQERWGFKPAHEESQPPLRPETCISESQVSDLSSLEWFPEETDREEDLVSKTLPSWAKVPYSKAKNKNPRFGIGEAQQRIKAAFCFLRSFFPEKAHLSLQEQDEDLIAWLLFNQARLPLIAGLNLHEVAVLHQFYALDPNLQEKPSQTLLVKSEEQLE